VLVDGRPCVPATAAGAAVGTAAIGAAVGAVVGVALEAAVAIGAGVGAGAGVKVVIGAGTAVGLAPGAIVNGGRVGGMISGAVAHAEDKNRSLISVTLPLRASALPYTVTLSASVIEVKAMIVPTNVEPVPRAAELPICQKTLQGLAPLMKLT
jgi:hypothetical protein